MSWQWIDEVFQLRLFLKLGIIKDDEPQLLPHKYHYLFPNLARFVDGQFKAMQYNKPFKKWKKPVTSTDGDTFTLFEQSEFYHDTSDLPQIASVTQLGKVSSKLRRDHLKLYLNSEDTAMTSITNRIDILNNVLIYQLLKKKGDIFHTLIRHETNPQIHILQHQISFYDCLFRNEYLETIEDNKEWIYLNFAEDDYDPDEDCDIQENLNSMWGIQLETGVIEGTSGKFCIVCWEGDLIYSQMVICKCCKGWGHFYQCWKEKESWETVKEDEYEHTCKSCRRDCEDKHCDKHKVDENEEIFKMKEMERDEFIAECHKRSNKLIRTMEISAKMWLYGDRYSTMMKMKQSIDIGVMLCITNKVLDFRGKGQKEVADTWIQVLEMWGNDALADLCDDLIGSYPNKAINKEHVMGAYWLFKDKLLELQLSGVLKSSYKKFKKHWRRKTGYKGYWCMEYEVERLFFSLPNMYDGVQPYLRIYDICSATDAIEAKMERIGKSIKKMLKKRPDLDLIQMAKEIILMENLPSVGKDDALLERIAKLFLIAHRNRSPLIAKEIRKYIVSSVVDRYLYDEQHQEEYDDDLNDKLTNLFKEIRDKSAKVTIDLTNDK
eukprot:173807_1